MMPVDICSSICCCAKARCTVARSASSAPAMAPISSRRSRSGTATAASPPAMVRMVCARRRSGVPMARVVSQPEAMSISATARPIQSAAGLDPVGGHGAGRDPRRGQRAEQPVRLAQRRLQPLPRRGAALGPRLLRRLGQPHHLQRRLGAGLGDAGDALEVGHALAGGRDPGQGAAMHPQLRRGAADPAGLALVAGGQVA